MMRWNIRKMIKMKKSKSSGKKMVKWTSCPSCGSTKAPEFLSTDTHVTWGVKIDKDGYISRNATIKRMGELPENSFLICTECNIPFAENVTIDEDGTIVRND